MYNAGKQNGERLFFLENMKKHNRKDIRTQGSVCSDRHSNQSTTSNEF